MIPYRRAVVGVTRAGPVRRLVGTPAGRRLVSTFVAGETLDDAEAAVRRLRDEGFSVSLDHLGEEVVDEKGVLAARDEYLSCLSRLGGPETSVSLKLTQLGLSFDRDLAASSLAAIAEAAGEAGTTVTVDMEDSRYTSATLDTYAAVQAVHGNVGVALQAALRRTPADLAAIRGLGGHVRLCKGAYLEPPGIAYRRREEVRAAFAALLGDLLSGPGPRPAVATHDEVLLSLAADLGRDLELQMLHGVRPDLQRRYLAAGFPVRVYVPYGAEWYPYLTRRLAERPANLGLFVRALPGALLEAASSRNRQER